MRSKHVNVYICIFDHACTFIRTCASTPKAIMHTTCFVTCVCTYIYIYDMCVYGCVSSLAKGSKLFQSKLAICLENILKLFPCLPTRISIRLSSKLLDIFSFVHCGCTKDPNVRKLFHMIKEMKKGDHPASARESKSDLEEEEEEEMSDIGSQDSPSDFEPDGVPEKASVGDDVTRNQQPPKKLPSSGSGRSKERARMDLVNHEIHELEEQLKYHGVSLRPFCFHNLFHSILIGPKTREQQIFPPKTFALRALGCDCPALPVEGGKEPKSPVAIPSDLISL